MIYLDNSATTRVSEAAAQKMLLAARDVWGNPSSLHDAGLAAEKLVDEARQSILRALGIRDKNAGRLIFCASGTEANNLALLGCLHAKRNNRPKRIVADNSQHSSVLLPLRQLEEEGVEVVYLSTAGGKIDPDELKAAINENTMLLSIMTVNNETGARYDIESAFAAAKRLNPNIVTHTDAVQAFMKVPFRAACADLISISGHKVHGPKGSAALFVSAPVLKARKLSPILWGGGQEEGFRSGTESVPCIAAFGAAVQTPFDAAQAAACRQYLLDHLPEGVHANLPAVAAPHILSLTMPHIRSEVMLHFLSAREIYVSSGSACSSHSHHTSSALQSFGLTPAEADCTIRVSLSGEETLEDVACFLSALEEGVATLIRTQ